MRLITTMTQVPTMLAQTPVNDHKGDDSRGDTGRNISVHGMTRLPGADGSTLKVTFDRAQPVWLG